MYSHEREERKEPREIKRIPYPSPKPVLMDFMEGYLDGRELSFKLAVDQGWYPMVDDVTPRIVIPCINTETFNYWQARAMIDHPIRYKSPAVPRRDSVVYINYPTMDTRVGLTEGPMDALAIGEFFPCIAIMGGHPSQEVIEHIRKLTAGRRAILIPDQDNTELIQHMRLVGLPYRIVIPTKKDIADMPRWERKQLLC